MGTEVTELLKTLLKTIAQDEPKSCQRKGRLLRTAQQLWTVAPLNSLARSLSLPLYTLQ